MIIYSVSTFLRSIKVQALTNDTNEQLKAQKYIKLIYNKFTWKYLYIYFRCLKFSKITTTWIVNELNEWIYFILID